MLLNACAPLIIFQSSCVIRIPLPAPGLSAETCFYSRHSSCVVLAGLCGGTGWRGHGGRLRRARSAASVAAGGAGSLTTGVGWWALPPLWAARSLPQTCSNIHRAALSCSRWLHTQRAPFPSGGDSLWVGGIVTAEMLRGN